MPKVDIATVTARKGSGYPPPFDPRVKVIKVTPAQAPDLAAAQPHLGGAGPEPLRSR